MTRKQKLKAKANLRFARHHLSGKRKTNNEQRKTSDNNACLSLSDVRT